MDDKEKIIKNLKPKIRELIEKNHLTIHKDPLFGWSICSIYGSGTAQQLSKKDFIMGQVYK